RIERVLAVLLEVPVVGADRIVETRDRNDVAGRVELVPATLHAAQVAHRLVVVRLGLQRILEELGGLLELPLLEERLADPRLHPAVELVSIGARAVRLDQATPYEFGVLPVLERGGKLQRGEQDAVLRGRRD